MRHRAAVALGFPVEAWQAFVTALPGPVGYRLRALFWRRRLRHMGANVRIDVGVHIVGADHVHLADHCWINRNVIILAGPPQEGRLTKVIENPDFPLEPGDVFIGENVHVAPNCVLSGLGGLYIGRNTGIASDSSIYSYSHHYRSSENDGVQYSFSSQASPERQAMIIGPVFIGDDCGVGLNSTVLPGTSLRRGTWVGCNAVVQGRFEEQSLIRAPLTPVVDSLSHLTIRE